MRDGPYAFTGSVNVNVDPLPGSRLDPVDVFDHNSGAQLASNVTSFTHADPGSQGDDLVIRVHSGSARQYRLTWNFT